MRRTWLLGPLLSAVMLMPGNAWTSGVMESDGSIWPRLVMGMRLSDERPEVLRWAERYARNPAVLRRMLARSEPFLWHIVDSVEARDMPMELALLPAIESGFDPHADSSRLARGLWQFMPATGADFGLLESVSFDARRDPIASTEAALRHLGRLNHSFGEDWLLTLAAYNGGEGRVRNAMSTYQGLFPGLFPPGFWDLRLPHETHDYVPRLLGMALLIREPQRFGITLPRIYDRHAAELVVLGRARNLASAAAAANVPLATVKRYNPGLIRLTDTGNHKTLLLPGREAGRLRRELSQHRHPPMGPLTEQGDGRHTVASGDSLSRLAERYGVSVLELCAWNGMQASDALPLGKRIRVAPVS